jgi:hypothetical protein
MCEQNGIDTVNAVNWLTESSFYNWIETIFVKNFKQY